MTDAAAADRLTFAPGMGDLIDRFDGLILDQWGVLHNGAALYDGVPAFLRAARDRGVPTAILTNSSKGERPNRERLRRLGVDDDLYGPLISTADLLKAHLCAADPAPRVYMLASGIDAQLFEDTDVQLVDRLEDATCVAMLTIPDSVAESPQSADWIAPALALGLPLHTPSADVQSVVPGGDVVYGFNRTIRHYRDQGGVVHLHGKPTAGCYDACRARLGLGPDARIAAVGDQFDTDVLGAVANGCAPVFVETGAAERDRGGMDTGAWRRFLGDRCAAAGVTDLTVLPSLRW